MKTVNWNADKAKLLKETREIELERVALMIEEKELLAVAKVQNRDQMMFILDYDDYIVCVPFIETEDEIFLKTAYRNRKFNKLLKGEES